MEEFKGKETASFGKEFQNFFIMNFWKFNVWKQDWVMISVVQLPINIMGSPENSLKSIFKIYNLSAEHFFFGRSILTTTLG